MPQLTYQTLRLRKRVPLAISRGTQTESHLMWIRLVHEGFEGWGEAGEFSVGSMQETMEDLVRGVEVARPLVESADPYARENLEEALLIASVPSAVRAGVAQALLDWYGRQIGQPVWRLLGLTPGGAPPTSVTIGISDPKAAVRRVQQWTELGEIRAFKIKLGSPEGIKADQQMFEAVQQALPKGVKVSVDANGGWEAEDAIALSSWLADRGVDHIEQPLARGRERELRSLRQRSALPIIADESCFNSSDIPGLVDLVDGINIKLMKCGGIPEALRMIHVAHAHGLQTMLGCYGSSALGNTAAAHLGSLVDHLDLDSHLNLIDDPFRGAAFAKGHLILNDQPGFGVTNESLH